MPQTVFKDTFIDTNGTLLKNHTPDVYSGTGTYTNEKMNSSYSPTAYNSDIQSNQISLDENGECWIVDTGISDDYSVSISWNPASGGGVLNRNSLIFRNQDLDNKLHVRIRKDATFDDITLMNYQGGVESTIGSAVTSVFANYDQFYVIKVVVRGQSIKVYVDDVLKIDQTSSLFTSATKVGFSRNTGGNTTLLDTFVFDSFDVSAAVTVAKSISASSLATAEFSKLLEISKSIAASFSYSGLEYESAFTISQVVDFLSSNNVAVGSILSVAKNLDISSSANLDADGNIVISKELDITHISQADIPGIVELAKINSFTTQNNVVLNINFGVDKSVAITMRGGLSAEETIALSKNLEILLNTLVTKEESFSLGKSLDISTVSLLDASGQIVLAKEIGIDANSIVTFETFINLDKTLLLGISGGISIEDAINIGLNLGITSVSEIYIVPISVLGTVEIKDQKYYLVIINDVYHDSVEISSGD